MSYFFRLVLGLCRRLPHVRILEFPQPDNVFRRELAQMAPMTKLPANLDEARQTIADLDLDVLVYLDLGMDPLTWHLARSRLAPVQCTLYGHPMTTGIANVDFFLSPGIMEPPDAQQHYSERLHPLPCLLSGYLPPPRPAMQRREKRRRVYLCAQSLFKIHPDMDSVLKRLLREDPEAELHFFVAGEARVTEALQTRFKQSLGSLHQRVIWLPQCAETEFLGLLTAADLVLDTPYFNGGSTSFKALASGVPVLTMESSFMRGRQTAGLYRYLNLPPLLDSCVAHSLMEYGDKALRLAHSQSIRQELSRVLLDTKDALFAVDDSVEHLALFLEGVQAPEIFLGE